MFACTITRFHKDNAKHSCLHREREKETERERPYFSFSPATCSSPLLFLHISVGPRKIGFQEEVISSSKEVECPRGRVPNEVYVRNKSSSGKKTRGMASNKGVAVRILGPLEKEVRPNFSTTLGSARVTRRNDFRYPNIFFRGNRRPFSQVSCPSLSICETRTMEANLAPKKMADHVSLGMAGISCTLKIVCQG